MKITIEIEDRLMAAVLATNGDQTMSAAIELALRALLASDRQREVKGLRGKVAWAGDLDAMRRDRRR